MKRVTMLDRDPRQELQTQWFFGERRIPGIVSTVE